MTAEDYLRRVAFELRDLPWKMRRDLISELRAHLSEVENEPDLAARLGPPREYAADMRAAAGLERRPGLVAFVRARRPRNVVLAVVALILAGLAIGMVTWVQSYQPLELGDRVIEPDGAVGTPTGDMSVVFHQGAPFQYGFTVRNTGQFGVRVLGGPDSSGLPVSAQLLMAKPTRDGLSPEIFTPFHPLDLNAGQALVLELRGVFDDAGGCTTGTKTTLLYSFPVRFSFLWSTRTALIALPGRLAIRRCP